MDTKEREALLEALLAGRLPDDNGRFGPFGGRYVPETLMPAIERVTYGVKQILPSAEFQRALLRELKLWVGRPTTLTPLPTLSPELAPMTEFAAATVPNVPVVPLPQVTAP